MHETSAIRKAAPFVGKAAAGADVVANFNDYKLNDPDVDSSASGTFNALREGDFAGAGRSLSKGMLETGMDLGSYAANTADFLVPGQPFSQGYNRMLRDHFGSQLVDNSGNGPAPTAPVATPAAPTAPVRPTNRLGQGFDDPRRLDRDPARKSLGESRDFTNELASVPANLPEGLREGVVHKTVDANGRTVYSGKNVGLNPQMVDGKGRDLTMRGSVVTAPAGSNVVMTDAGGGGYAFADAPRAQDVAKAKALGGRIGEGGNIILPSTDRALTNPDGSRWTERDNRLMADNLRAGVDRYAGTSRAPKAQTLSPGQQYMQQALNAPRTLKNLTPAQMSRIQAQAALLDSQAADRAVTQENNQMASSDRRYQADAPMKVKQVEMDLAARMRQAQADLWKQAGGDPRAAAELSVQAGLDPEKFNAMEKTRQETDSKARDHTMSQLNNAFYTDGPKGERVQDKETASKAYEYLNRVTGGRYESLPETERSKYFAEALTRFGMVQGANARRKTGLFEQLGLSNPTPAFGDLPTDDQLKGATLREAGIGWDTIVGQPSALDYQLTTPDGREMYLPKGMTQPQLKYLEDRGVKLPK